MAPRVRAWSSLRIPRRKRRFLEKSYYSLGKIDNFLFFSEFYRFFLLSWETSTFKTTIQRTPNTLGVEESSSPRKVPHFYSSNSSRGRMRAELWRSYTRGKSKLSSGVMRATIYFWQGVVGRLSGALGRVSVVASTRGRRTAYVATRAGGLDTAGCDYVLFCFFCVYSIYCCMLIVWSSEANNC